MIKKYKWRQKKNSKRVPSIIVEGDFPRRQENFSLPNIVRNVCDNNTFHKTVSDVTTKDEHTSH